MMVLHASAAGQGKPPLCNIITSIDECPRRAALALVQAEGGIRHRYGYVIAARPVAAGDGGYVIAARPVAAGDGGIRTRRAAR
ncbi:MAG: hypothetical protein AB7F67_01770 [Rhodospirillaceae bacterium]